MAHLCGTSGSVGIAQDSLIEVGEQTSVLLFACGAGPRLHSAAGLQNINHILAETLEQTLTHVIPDSH